MHNHTNIYTDSILSYVAEKYQFIWLIYIFYHLKMFLKIRFWKKKYIQYIYFYFLYTFTRNIHVIAPCSLTPTDIGATSELNWLKYSPKLVFNMSKMVSIKSKIHRSDHTHMSVQSLKAPRSFFRSTTSLVFLYFLFMFSFTTSTLIWDQSYTPSPLSLFLPPFPFSRPSTTCHIL